MAPSESEATSTLPSSTSASNASHTAARLQRGSTRLKAPRAAGRGAGHGPTYLAAKNRQLVAEHEDLEFLGSITAAEQHDQLEQAADDDVHG